MSIRYGQFCPVSKAAEVLGERWTILIIRELLLGTTRFNDFQRALSQISPTLLTKRLSQLQECGLVIRKTLPDQRRTEYQPMPAAKELKPVIFALGEWGMKWARGQMNDDELDVELLMYDLHRRIDVTQLPGGRTVIKFLFRGLPKFGHWWIVLEDGAPELCVDNPGKEVDVHLTTDLRTMAHIWAGDMEIRAAKKSGQLQLTGNPVLVRTVSAWLRPGLFAHVRPRAETLSQGDLADPFASSVTDANDGARFPQRYVRKHAVRRVVSENEALEEGMKEKLAESSGAEMGRHKRAFPRGRVYRSKAPASTEGGSVGNA